jgi:hypothetical protein
MPEPAQTMTTSTTSQKKPFLVDGPRLRLLWFLVPAALWALAYTRNRFNNYRIFKQVFWNVLEGRNLYLPNPAKHADLNHYGPVFALVIAPFAVLPDVLGGLLWCVAMAAIFTWAVSRLALPRQRLVLLLALCSLELWDSIWSQQFNPAVSALLLLTFVEVEEGRDFRAPLWILIGAFVKLYGVVGLLFFFFARDKKAFVAGTLTWSVMLLVLPMAISSPAFVLQTYGDWYVELVAKHAKNVILYSSSDLSLMGLVRRVSGRWIPSSWFYLVGIPLVLSPLLRVGQYQHARFRTLFLASLLMFVVLFSSGSENTTYIVCATGAVLWFVEQERPFRRRNVVLLVALLLVGIAPTDLLTKQVRELTDAYAVIALPYTVVWLLLCRDLLTRDFALPPTSGTGLGVDALSPAAARPG